LQLLRASGHEEYEEKLNRDNNLKDMAQDIKEKGNGTVEVPIRPSQYAEKMLITSVLNGTYPKGTALPSERALSLIMGVTRPTLRETLQRLAGEGWFTIRHGKPTLVNDYWSRGGMGLLSTLSKYADYLPEDFIPHLLELRASLLPMIARRAAENSPETIIEYLKGADQLADEAGAFSTYDWGLQTLMARNTGNPIYVLMLNDFEHVFKSLAFIYFSRKSSRKDSSRYYRELKKAMSRGAGDGETVVRATMEKSIKIWEKIRKTVN
jgi:GntR family negative regulator for fad regulon and positive regulator of fabA